MPTPSPGDPQRCGVCDCPVEQPAVATLVLPVAETVVYVKLPVCLVCRERLALARRRREAAT